MTIRPLRQFLLVILRKFIHDSTKFGIRRGMLARSGILVLQLRDSNRQLAVVVLGSTKFHFELLDGGFELDFGGFEVALTCDAIFPFGNFVFEKFDGGGCLGVGLSSVCEVV